MSNDACEADIIEGGNLKYLKNVPYHCCCFLDEKSCPLHIDKPTFQSFAHYAVMRRKQEWQRYITSIYTKIHTVLVQMYFTAEVDMPEDFRSELGQFMLGKGGTVAQDIQTVIVSVGVPHFQNHVCCCHISNGGANATAIETIRGGAMIIKEEGEGSVVSASSISWISECPTS